MGKVFNVGEPYSLDDGKNFLSPERQKKLKFFEKYFENPKSKKKEPGE